MPTEYKRILHNEFNTVAEVMASDLLPGQWAVAKGDEALVCKHYDSTFLVLPLAQGGLVKSTAQDAAAGYLADKLAAGSGVSLAVVSGPGGTEQVQVSATLPTVTGPTILGRNDGDAGQAEQLTAAEVAALLPSLNPSGKGLAPSTGATPSSRKFLQETNAWAEAVPIFDFQDAAAVNNISTYNGLLGVSIGRGSGITLAGVTGTFWEIVTFQASTRLQQLLFVKNTGKIYSRAWDYDAGTPAFTAWADMTPNATNTLPGLADVADTATSGAAAGQVLMWNGTTWVNSSLSVPGGPLAVAYVTFPDADADLDFQTASVTQCSCVKQFICVATGVITYADIYLLTGGASSGTATVTIYRESDGVKIAEFPALNGGTSGLRTATLGTPVTLTAGQKYWMGVSCTSSTKVSLLCKNRSSVFDSGASAPIKYNTATTPPTSLSSFSADSGNRWLPWIQLR